MKISNNIINKNNEGAKRYCNANNNHIFSGCKYKTILNTKPIIYPIDGIRCFCFKPHVGPSNLRLVGWDQDWKLTYTMAAHTMITIDSRSDRMIMI